MRTNLSPEMNASIGAGDWQAAEKDLLHKSYSVPENRGVHDRQHKPHPGVLMAQDPLPRRRKVMQRVCDLYSGDEFQNMLRLAGLNSRYGKEEDFVYDLQDRFDKWGEEMFLSEAQDEWLCKIADR